MQNSNASMAPETPAASETVDKAESTRSSHFFQPNVDIIERPDELTLVADMPGLATDLIDVNFEDGTLTIHGRAPLRQPKETKYLLNEYGVGDFYRTFRVSEAIDASRISADYGAGVLTLHLPKSEGAKSRKIAVQGR